MSIEKSVLEKLLKFACAEAKEVLYSVELEREAGQPADWRKVVWKP